MPAYVADVDAYPASLPLSELATDVLEHVTGRTVGDIRVSYPDGASGVLAADDLVEWIQASLRTRATRVEYDDRRLQALVSSSTDAIVVVDRKGRISYASPAYTRITGVSASAAIGSSAVSRLHDDDAARFVELFSEAGERDGHRLRGRFRLRGADGSCRRCEITVRSLLCDPAVNGAVMNIRDSSEEHRLQGDLHRQARRDELTGLANRTFFIDRLELAVAGLGETDAKPLGVLYFDMDGFKSVNDSLGHGAGDELLVEVGRRLDAGHRRGETIARLGGDEFGLLITDAGSSDPVQAAQRFRKELSEPFLVQGQPVPLRASFGVVVEDEPTVTAEELLRRADVAMFAAKQSGRDGVRLWTPDIDSRFSSRMGLVSELAKALDEDLLHLVYQPYYDLSDGALAGIEALVRWQHPERGTIFPDEFIPVAEASGLIITLGRWVLRTACQQAAHWLAEGRVGDRSVMSVNVSPPELMDTGFESTVMAALAESGLDPTRLQLEVTETAIIEDTDMAADTLERLRKIGVRIAVDDFGTGYASMSYLRRLPVDVIKIDKSFVDGVSNNARDSLIVGGIVSLADALDVDVIAEGVEDASQAAALVELGCHKAQGYHFSRPQTPDRFPFGSIDTDQGRFRLGDPRPSACP